MARKVLKMKMRVVTVHLPEAYIEALDLLVRRRLYPNRAEAIRMAVRDLIISELAFRTERAEWIIKRVMGVDA